MANIYNHILPLCDVKNYLRVEEEFTEDDSAIERMIASAFGYISKVTNHVFKAQDKDYFAGNLPYINVYDTPINTDVFDDNCVPLRFGTFVRFHQHSLTLNVGYTSRVDVPTELIEAALQMIKVWYYEAEKQVNTTLLPENVKEILDSHRRFIAC